MGLLRDLLLGPKPLERQTASSDLYDTQVADFWANLASSTGASNPTLIERVWVANRCQHMCAQAIASMPLRFYGSREPAWVANPDPVWFPNGIGDAVYAAVDSMYGYGDAFVYVTSRYADTYPSAWTVLNPAPMGVDVKNGRRAYRSGQANLDPDDMVQITRNPRAGTTRGTSAIASYSAYTNGLLAAADLGRVMMGSGGTPNAVIKSLRKIDQAQATAIQNAWMTAVSARRGAPAVLGPDLSFEQLAFSPADLMLLDAQKFDAQVIASAYGMPAVLVNVALEDGLTYQTPILALEQWWREELLPRAVQVQTALSAQMLPQGSYVEFDARKFLAPTFADLVEAWAKILESGGASLEEFRAAVLGLTQGEAQDALLTPPSAGASPSQQPSNVAELRPTSSQSTY